MKTKILTILLLGFVYQVFAQELGIRAGIELYKFRRFNGEMWTLSEKYTASPSFGMSFRVPFKMRSAFRTGFFFGPNICYGLCGDYSAEYSGVKCTTCLKSNTPGQICT